MPDRFGSNESPYDALRAATLGSVSRADSNNDLLYLRLDATNDPVTGALDIQTDSATALRVLDSGNGARLTVDTLNTYNTLADNQFRHTDINGNGLIRSIGFDGAGRIRESTSPINANQSANISLGPTNNGWLGVGSHIELRDIVGAASKVLELRMGTTGAKIASWSDDAITDPRPIEVAIGPDTASLPIIAQFQNTALDSAVFVAQGKQYTGVRINGTTHGQLILAANSIDQWSIYSQSDHLLRFYKFDGTPGDAMSLTNAGVLTTSRFISTIATGTAPLDVSSTTLVTNLNADLLDGLHASAFPNVGAASAQYQYITTGAGPTYTPAWSGGYLNIASGKTLTVNDSMISAGQNFANTFTALQTLAPYGTYRGALEFDGTGSLSGAPWRTSTLLVGTSSHDHVLMFSYNARSAAGGWERIEDGDVIATMGLESRFVSVGDPALIKGQFEWYIRLDPALTGTPSFTKEPFALLYNYDTNITTVQIGDSVDAGANVLNVAGAVNARDTYGFIGKTHAIGTTGVLLTFNRPIQITGTVSTTFPEGLTFSNFAMVPGAGLDATVFNANYITFGAASDNVGHVNGFVVDGTTWVKGTSGTISTATAMSITAPTFAATNWALRVESGASYIYNLSLTKSLKISDTAQEVMNLKTSGATTYIQMTNEQNGGSPGYYNITSLFRVYAGSPGYLRHDIYDDGGYRNYYLICNNFVIGSASSTGQKFQVVGDSLLNGSVSTAYAAISANTTLDNTHSKIKVTAAATITLPTAVGCAGREYNIKATVNGVIVNTTSSQTIDTSTSYTLFAYDALNVYSDGANWVRA